MDQPVTEYYGGSLENGLFLFSYPGAYYITVEQLVYIDFMMDCSRCPSYAACVQLRKLYNTSKYSRVCRYLLIIQTLLTLVAKRDTLCIRD